MPFSLTESKDSALGYIHQRPTLSNIFFNPFLLCIIIVLIILIIHFSYEKEYEEDCTYVTVLKHSITNYVGVLILIIVHDMLIKNKYRSKICDLEKKIEEYENAEITKENSIYQKI